MADQRLERDVRVLKGYAVASSVLLGLLTLGAFRQSTTPRFEELDAERVNIIEKNGQIRLVLANKARTPGPMERNVPFGYGPGTRTGLIFYNEEGTEAGGMIWTGQATVDGKASAVGSLTFDQYNQDQTVALQYVENTNGSRRAGLAINDLPTDISSAELSRKREEIMKVADTTARRSALAELRRRYPFTGRAYFGKNLSGAAVVDLSDARGRSRLRLVVDSSGPARLEFLDDSGRVTFKLPN